jgi:PAS domain S-box-containing protein
MQPPTILIVEDEVIVARDLQERLTAIGYSVPAIAASGPEGLRIVELVRPDLMLMDIRLKGQMDGIETAEQIRDRFGVGSVYLTAYDDEETLRRAKLTEPFGYLLKPFDDRMLRCTLEMAFYRERTKAELESAQRLAQVGSWTWDAETETLTWSKELCRIAGRDSKLPVPPLGKQSQLFTAESWTRLDAARQAAIRTGAGYELELEMLRPDGSRRWITSRCETERDPAGTVIRLRGTVHDITERRTLEEQLRHAQKMEAVGRLAGGMAHDINNLLTVIIGQCEFFPEQGPAESASSLREIRKAAERAATLTRQVLAFSRRQMLQPRVLSLNETVSNVSAMLKRLIGQDIRLEVIQEEGLGFVHADPTAVEQVIMNLAVNARDAMPQGGKLTIRTANAAEPAGAVAGAPGACVTLRVTDTGCGMDETTRNQIFEPFFTTKEKTGGTGLGLSTVYGIVNQSGGSIAVDTEPGKGSAFTIYLPRVNEEPQSAPLRPSQTRAQKEAGVVLLVEDEPAVRKLAKRMLEAGGYTVIEAGDPQDALALCTATPREIDLLLTDVSMPQMSGSVLAEEIRKLRQDMKVIYMSGYTDGALGLNGGLRPWESFLQKPFTLDGLLEVVRDMMQRGLPERRQHARIDYPGIQVQCHTGKQEMTLGSVNVGEGGMLLKDVPAPIPAGETVGLRFKAATAGEALNATARVVRTDPPGQMAVEFEDLSMPKLAALIREISRPD